jgi:hypothetical protein
VVADPQRWHGARRAVLHGNFARESSAGIAAAHPDDAFLEARTLATTWGIAYWIGSE